MTKTKWHFSQKTKTKSKFAVKMNTGVKRSQWICAVSLK